jgi:hypothetical protein
MAVRGRDVHEVIGQRLQQLRGEVSGARVAREAQAVGLGWSRQTLVDVENGRRKVWAGELLALPVVLSMATGRHVTLQDLIANEGVVIGDRFELSKRDVQRLLEGEPVVPAGYTPLSIRDAQAIMERWKEQMGGRAGQKRTRSRKSRN